MSVGATFRQSAFSESRGVEDWESKPGRRKSYNPSPNELPKEGWPPLPSAAQVNQLLYYVVSADLCAGDAEGRVIFLAGNPHAGCEEALESVSIVRPNKAFEFYHSTYLEYRTDTDENQNPPPIIHIPEATKP